MADSEHLSVGEVARRLNVSVQLVHQLWREGLLPPPMAGPREGWAYWHVADIEQAIAEGRVMVRRPEIRSRSAQQALVRNQEIRRRFAAGETTVAELAAAYGRTPIYVRCLLRGAPYGPKHRTQLQEDGLQLAIDRRLRQR